MSVIPPQIPARLRRVLGRFVGPAGAALFSLVLASCAGGGFGGASDTPAVNPVSQPAPVASGPISPESQRNVAEALSSLNLGDETPPISPENIAVSDDAEILNRNPFSSSAPAARASGWGARADSTRKTPGYKAFEVAVPSENPLMTVAVWISETPPDYPEGKPEQDPEADRKFLYLRLQVFIEVEHVALVEGGGVEVLDSEVIVVEEKRPDPKPQPQPTVVAEPLPVCGSREFRDEEGSCSPILGADLLCPSGTMPANGLTQAELDAGLLSAATSGDLAGACEHLRRGANPNGRDQHKHVPLMRANADLEMGKLLLNNGADLTVWVEGWWTPLFPLYGVYTSAQIEFYLSRGVDPNFGPWDSTWNPLHGAAYSNKWRSMKLLLDAGADPNIQTTRPGWRGGAPLHYVFDGTRSGSALAVSVLLSGGAEVNARDNGGRSALDLAARSGDAASAEILRAAGGQCFVATGPLCEVVEAATPDPVTLEAVTSETVCESGSLSTNGLTQTELDEGLLSAARDNDLEGVCEYLRRGANVDAQESRQSFRRTALMIAATGGFLELAKLLHVNGGDVRHQGGYFRKSAVETSPGWSALHYAAGAGHAAIVSWLLDVGADIDARWYVSRYAYRGSKSVIMEAAYWGRPDVIKILLSRGADMNALWLQGHTPLHAALNLYGPNVTNVSHDTLMASYDPPNEDSYARALSLLASHASDVNARTFWGWTALDYAVHQNNARFAEILRGYGGRCFGRTGPLCGEVQVAVDFSSSGAGTVSAEGDDGALAVGGEVRQGATVVFTATPAAGRYVSGWSGNCAEVGEVADGLDGAAKFCAVSADSDLSVHAEFSEIPSLAGPLCESGSLSTNGLAQAQLDAGLISAAERNDLPGACEYLRRGANADARESGRYYKRTALMIAANDGFLDLAKLLHANGADVNLYGGTHDGNFYGRDRRGYPALHYAGVAGHPELVGWLLDSGAELNSEWESGKTALWDAAYWGRPDVVELLLSRGAETETYFNGGATPLHAAVMLEGVSARRYWANGPAFRYKQMALAYSYPTPTADEHGQVVSLLLSHDAEVNARYQFRSDSGGRSPLDYAARQGDERLSAMLRDAGGICFVETGPLCPVVTAVTTAVTIVASTVVTAETICESGSLSANGLTQAQLDSGLLSAARDNDLEGACEYLRRGANVEAQESEWRYHKRTALMIAATDGSLDMAKLLRTNGADVNRQGGNYHNGIDSAAPSNGNRRMPALHYAAGAGHKDFAEWLLAEGADLHALQTIERGALWEAAFWGRVDIVKLFLSSGADVNARDMWGATPFLNAAHFPIYLARHEMPRWGVSDGYDRPLDSAWPTVLSLLVSSGAEVNVRYNSSGSSALDVAVSEGNAEYAELLRGYGVRCFVQTGPLCGIPDVAVEYAVIPADESGGTVSAEGDDGVLSHEDEVRQGTTLTFTATPALGWMLSAWGGDAADCSGFVCALAANSDLSVHAEFSPILSLTDLSCPAGTLPTNGLTAAELNMTLRMAARGGDATRVCEALRRGAEVNDNLDDSEFTPLQEAVSGGHLEAAKVLLANGAEVNKRKDGAGHSPLDLAARDGEAEIAALLRNADGRCFLETGPLCQNVPVATPDPMTVVNTVAATVAAGSCPAGTLDANGMTQAQLNQAMLGAVEDGDLEEVCEYLRRGADVNTYSTGRHTGIFALVFVRDNVEMAKLLLENGANVNRTGPGGDSRPPLFFTGGWLSPEVVRLYLSHGANPNFGGEVNWNPLHEAAYYNKWEIMKVLLTAGADPDIQTTRSGWRNGAPLHYVFDGTRSDSALAVSVLVAGDADVNLRDSGGNSALDLAANRGDAASAEILRAAGGQCFVSTRPLCEVVPVATPDPVTVVNTVASTVAAGSCPAGTLPTNGMTQAQLDAGLLSAASSGDLAEACEHLRRGANPNGRDQNEHVPLMRASSQADLEMGKLLLDNGADLTVVWVAGGRWTPLFAQYNGGYTSARLAAQIEFYLSRGVDPNFGSSAWNPLHEAAYYNEWRSIKLLLDAGADPNIQTTRSGWRNGAPLHYVFDGTRSGSALAVSVLVAGDADVNLRDSGGNSALDLAARGGDAAAAEILRAAGGQCFVSTSSLCGSAPAPAAAAAESAPATDRLRESFAGAFNPSPAFGDAFGATSGSSQRFLSRLDSLMRSASSSGGNAWDSFAGWQRENEHGRMWFSTGQRGDFGFGAGVGGAGGDLSASPFAAMVGNGMLAGGETGLGAESKLRIAAFADYQARSLLDGTDRQWTKWAASGTAIETAMTEAERFSGLAENQTRGAMTEIHLGGGDLGVALQAGAVSESDAMLSGTADDENLRGLRARTAFAGLSGAADLFGSGWRLRGSAHLGRSWAESESMLRDGDLWASAFSAGLERGGWLYSDDGFVLRFSQPLRVESLEMELIGADGASRLGADPSGRQLDVDAAYRLPLSGGGWLLLSAGVRRDGGHTSSSDLEAGALFSVERGF